MRRAQTTSTAEVLFVLGSDSMTLPFLELITTFKAGRDRSSMNLLCK